MYGLIEGKTLNVGPNDKYNHDTFQHCRIVLKGGAPEFLHCTFLDCTFEPALPVDGKGFGIWQDILRDCQVKFAPGNA